MQKIETSPKVENSDTCFDALNYYLNNERLELLLLVNDRGRIRLEDLDKKFSNVYPIMVIDDLIESKEGELLITEVGQKTLKDFEEIAMGRAHVKKVAATDLAEMARKGNKVITVDAGYFEFSRYIFGQTTADSIQVSKMENAKNVLDLLGFRINSLSGILKILVRENLLKKEGDSYLIKRRALIANSIKNRNSIEVITV